MDKKKKAFIVVIAMIMIVLVFGLIIKLILYRNDKKESSTDYDILRTFDKNMRIFDIATSEDADASALISGYVDDEGDVIITTDSNDIIDSFTEDDKEYIVIKDENGDKTQIEV